MRHHRHHLRNTQSKKVRKIQYGSQGEGGHYKLKIYKTHQSNTMWGPCMDPDLHRPTVKKQ